MGSLLVLQQAASSLDRQALDAKAQKDRSKRPGGRLECGPGGGCRRYAAEVDMLTVRTVAREVESDDGSWHPLVPELP